MRRRVRTCGLACAGSRSPWCRLLARSSRRRRGAPPPRLPYSLAGRRAHGPAGRAISGSRSTRRPARRAVESSEARPRPAERGDDPRAEGRRRARRGRPDRARAGRTRERPSPSMVHVRRRRRPPSSSCVAPRSPCCGRISSSRLSTHRRRRSRRAPIDVVADVSELNGDVGATATLTLMLGPTPLAEPKTVTVPKGGGISSTFEDVKLETAMSAELSVRDRRRRAVRDGRDEQLAARARSR